MKIVTMVMLALMAAFLMFHFVLVPVLDYIIFNGDGTYFYKNLPVLWEHLTEGLGNE